MNRLPYLWVALVLLCLAGREAEADPPLAVAPFNGRQAKAHQKAWADHLGVPVQITNSIGMKLNLIPPGEFAMGSPESAAGHRDDETQHRVQITKLFYLSAHEVTQVQYEQVVDKNPSYYSASGKGKNRVSGIDTSQFPVDSVTWNDAVEFCRKLSDKEGVEYRLPTEAEWEYACRAGMTTIYSSGSGSLQLDTTGWFGDNSGKTVIDTTRIWETDKVNYKVRLNGNGSRPHVVRRKSPNAWGLYDMHGNVAEWCQDWYAPYGGKTSGNLDDIPASFEITANAKVVSDPTGPAQGKYRLLRGGAFCLPPTLVRAADRDGSPPGARKLLNGFRLARTIP